MNYIKKHYKIFLSAFLFMLCFVLYFLQLGEYPLIDTDETKYVSIARDMINRNDWINLKLNGNNFFECPPLLFWIINFSFIIFGKISTLAARIPIAVITTIGIISIFLITSKILTKSYGLIISLITATSFGFLVFSHLATNDILYTVTTMLAILLSYLSIFSKANKYNYPLWCGIYFFMSLSVLSGGLFGLCIPLLSIIAMHIFSGKIKELFKPLHLLSGLLILILITFPWFFIMFEKHGVIFIKEFISVYDISKNIGIKNCLNVISLFILGFLPWSFSFLWIIGSKFRDIINSVTAYFKENSQEKLKEKWQKLNKSEKFLSLNTIVFFTSLIFALIFGAKNIYIVLFLTFPASNIAGYYWYAYMFRKKHAKSILFATIIPNLLFMICSFAGLFGYNFINTLTSYGFNFLIIPLVIIFFIIPLIGIFSVVLNARIPAYISNLILIISLSFVLTPGIFNFITINGGENDLIEFARKANTDKVKLSTFTASKKYSLVYYYDNIVDFHLNNDFVWLETFLETNKKDYVITEIKDLWTIEEKNIKYMLLDSGKRYCLIKHLPKVEEEQQQEEKKEPEINIY